MRDKSGRLAIRFEGIIRAGTPLLVAVVFPGCFAETDTDGPGSPPEADSAGKTLELAGPPSGAPLFPEVFSVTDAAMHQGVWFVLDGRGNQVHRIDPDGGTLRSFGREGSGPGEFRRASAIVAHGDSIIVVDHGIVHVFSPVGRHIEDRGFRPGPGLDCVAATVRVSDAVSTPAGLLMLGECLRPDGGTTVHAAVETVDGTIRSLAHRDGQAGRIDLDGMAAVVARHPQGFLFGSGWERCLDLISLSGQGLDTICHDWLERLDIPPEAFRELEGAIAEARGLGIRVELPESMPALVGVSAMPRGRLVYRVFAPGDPDMETLQWVTRGEAGRAVPLPLPSAPLLFLDGESALAAWNEMEGTRIDIRTVDSLDAN